MISFVLLFAMSVTALAQTETPPKPGAPREVQIPKIVKSTLPNRLSVMTVQHQNVPLVTIHLLVRAGASAERFNRAGLAMITAQMLTKGTKTRSASAIAEQVEFLGGSIASFAGWNNSVVQITVSSDKVDQATAILADVVLNSAFSRQELDLLKTQTLDGLSYNLKQPGFLASYVSSVYGFGEHPSGGTPDGVKAISRADVVAFRNAKYRPEASGLIFTGDISPATASALARKYFSRWTAPRVNPDIVMTQARLSAKADEPVPTFDRFLVIDLPDSGQASVNYVKRTPAARKKCATTGKCSPDKSYYTANVLNSVLGGGYSSRLNQEIRIKRGLSYGAGSGFSWRSTYSAFSTRTQTKNESAAQVAELVVAELEKLSSADVSEAELAPRKLVLTGEFGREMETTGGLAEKAGELFGFSLDGDALTEFVPMIRNTSAEAIRAFAGENIRGGDIIIVGDYKMFKDDLAKRFPKKGVTVVAAEGLDLEIFRY